MLGRGVLLIAALAVCGSQARALPVHVALDWPTGMPASGLARAHIQAVRMEGGTNSALPVEAEAGPDGAVLDLGDGVWQVQASTPGYWSQEAEVTLGPQAAAPASVRLALWPAAFLRGEILPAEGEPLPRALEVELSATPASAGEMTGPQPELSPSRAELHCRIDGRTWSCVGPAGLFDVRLEASGYAPRYEWGVSLKAAESTDLGRTELRRTASVFGRAVRKDGSDPPVPCWATLGPDLEWRGGLGPDPESAPVGEKSFSVPLSPRGYFQVVGVLPGRHVLDVECQAASGFRELRVQADGETRVDPPLLLGELTLDVAITPKADPEGRPWQLTVDATAPRLRRIADKVTTSADGRWVRRGLMAGNYRVVVSNSDGTPWLQQYFDLGADSGPLSLHLASVKVAGRVLLKMQPVRARLVFSNEAGGEPVTLNSDDQGSFQGLLPIAADALETTWIVDAHVAQPHTNRRLVDVEVPSVTGGASAWLDLVLPTIAVRGSVVSEDGKPQHGTQVTFENSTGPQTTTATDDAGSFEMPDLSPGQYTAVAHSFDAVSDRVPFEVTEGSESELKLILHPFMHIPFYVVSNQGPISDAAVQVWITPGVPRAYGRTDPDGRFEAKLPPGTTEVGLTVGAPDYALKLTRMPVSIATDPSQNANTISLDTSGGTLVLNFQPPEGTLDSSATLYLVHNGAIADARTVAGWGTDTAGTSGDGPAVVDEIEPGDYALCIVTDPVELAAIWQGALPPDLCSTGSVEQGRTLSLSPQSPKRR
jgi:hypothetical protein